MKKLFGICTIVLILSFMTYIPVLAEDDDWKTMPEITHVYELSKEKVYLEWEGKAELNSIKVDGKDVKTVKINNASIEVKTGSHTITIVPIKLQSKNANTQIELNIANYAGGSIDLGALGVDPKDILQGNQSKPYKLKYNVNPILNAVPTVNGAYTDFDNRVLLTFTDKYDSDVYYVTIKSGKDVIGTYFDMSSADAASLISKQNAKVTITLDPEFLKKNGWLIPELDEKYGFSVKLGKWPVNMIDNSKEPPTVLESKESKYYDYTPYAAWKNAPDITYASQTADGTITLKWEHDDNGLGCEYKIVSPDKVLMVKKGAKEVGKTSNKEFTVKDLMNGKHAFAVIPMLKNEEGFSSDNQTIEVVNNWVVAPTLECSLKENKQVLLKWEAPQGVDNYHITVSAGSGSLLRFVNMDYKKYKEFDVKANPGKMEYTFTYDQSIESEDGAKLKFEIYATRKTEKGEDQKSATSSQTIVVK